MRSSGQRHRPSSWSRGKRDLASPQGLTLMMALMLSFVITILGMVLESVLHVPKSVVFVAIIVSYIVVMGVAVYKILARNKRDAEARREAYREKFEKKSGIR